MTKTVDLSDIQHQVSGLGRGMLVTDPQDTPVRLGYVRASDITMQGEFDCLSILDRLGMEPIPEGKGHLYFGDVCGIHFNVRMELV